MFLERSLKARLPVLLLIVSVVALIQPSTSHATTINSTIHGFASDHSPQNGLGDQANALVVEVFNGAQGGNQDRGIIEFNIFGLTGSVSSATLTLPIGSNGLSATRNFAVFGYTGDGVLLNSDYEVSASSIGTFNVAAGQTGSINVDVTDFINAQIALNDPQHFAGFKIVWNSGPSSSDVIAFSALEGSVFPTLDVVNAVPLPATLPLFATSLGALGLIGWRRKRKHAA